MTMFTTAEIAEFRALVADGLDHSCALQSVNDSTGVRTTLATVPCRTEAPSAATGTDWMADGRRVVIVLPHDCVEVGIADLIVLDGATVYRAETVNPIRTRAVSRRAVCYEDRSPGGPV